MRGNIKSFEKPFTHAEVVALAERTLKRFGGDRNKAGRYARSMEDRYESAKWAQVVEVIATSRRHHATIKTSPAQLDRDIAEALGASSSPRIEEAFGKLPEGWMLGPVGPAESDSAKRFLLLVSPTRHMATLDLDDRCVRLGFSTRSPAILSGYRGPGWRAAMLADAIRAVAGR